MVYGSSIGRSLQPVVGETILDTSDLSINMFRDIYRRMHFTANKR